MKCNYKRNDNITYPRKAIQVVDGQFKEIPLSENEYIEVLFEQYDMEIVTSENKLINALKQGNYVIGVDYNPFLFQNVFHYENGLFEIFKFENIGGQIAPLRLKREKSILHGTNISLNLKTFVDAMPHYDEFVVYRKGNLLDIENIPPSSASFMK